MVVDGFINFNKEKGRSSQSAVAAIKRLLHVKSGHCGTLDPEATGVLPICLGKATRLSDLVMGQKKTYLGTVCFGIATDSYDAAGAKTAVADAGMLSREQVEQALSSFIGEIEQVPPMVSAIKKDGQPLYKRARAGEKLDLPARKVNIYAIRLQSFTNGNPAYAQIEVECGQGTYIRSIAYDLGQKLGLPAHLCSLQRSSTGVFHLADSYTLAELQQLVEQGDMSFIRPMNEVIDFLPAVSAPARRLSWISHGHDLDYSGELSEQSLVRVLDDKEQLIALGKVTNNGKAKTINMEKVLIDAYDNIACAVGNFDGLHLGHRALFERLAALKRQQGTKSEILTFSPHPLTLIKGEPPELLSGDSLKTALLVEYFGIDKVVNLEFNQQVMNSSPQEFVDDIIVSRLRANHLIVGYNFSFAKEGKGDAALLAELCAKRGITVQIVPKIDSKLGTLSASNIRCYLKKGEMQTVNEMLGYWFVMEGEVVYGNQLGHQFGYPTANFCPDKQQAVPATGVYAARIEHDGKTYDGVANFGIKPTIGGIVTPLVEAHLFDVDLDLYGQKIRVWFGKHLRAEKKFANTEELTRQINADSKEARDFLANIPQNKHLPKRIR